ncbi:hypothetical protein SK3146_00822 [Paenibacillus konkukensis]|uniref:Uncharacterized protein n=1 Tax=Paenibacillus konkukensis TaxID=2020716 RepID=A0ABY4RGU1_9BACL|nr:hypothetical protein [Paenibacillus konkukensis]UQZ81666.1 hypothetical protein SK3146_00822 [Paenibacillus konkukensis]
MENNKNQFILIMAGYSQGMEQLLQTDTAFGNVPFARNRIGKAKRSHVVRLPNQNTHSRASTA